MLCFRGTERLDANQNYKIDAWAPFVEKAVYALLLGAGSTLLSVCGSTDSLCESFDNSTALLARNVKNVVMKDEFGRPRRVFDDNGDGLVGYNIYSVAFDGVAVYESVSQTKANGG